MNEIEVKAKVSNLPSLLKKLEEIGCTLSTPISQVDRIFIPLTASIPTSPGEAALRIREQDGKYLYTVKQTKSNDLDCIEKEIEVSKEQATILLETFPLIRFREVESVKKIRRKTKYKELEICIDEVEELGTFIEVEKLSDEENGEQIQEELFVFLESLGVKREERVLHGYDILLHHKHTN